MGFGGGFLAGFSKGVGDAGTQATQSYMDMQTRKYESMSKIWEAMANDPNYAPEVKQKFMQTAMTLQGGRNLFDPNARKAAEEAVKLNPTEEAQKAHDAQNMLGVNPNARYYDKTGYSGPSQQINRQADTETARIQASRKANIDFLNQITGGQAFPQLYNQQASPNAPQGPMSGQPTQGMGQPPQMPQQGSPAQSGGIQGPPTSGLHVTPLMLKQMEQSTMGLPDTSRVSQGSWVDPVTGQDRLHEPVTWVGGVPYGQDGQMISAKIVDPPARYLYNGPKLVDAATMALHPETDIRKPTIERKNVKFIDSEGREQNYSETSYGGAGGGPQASPNAGGGRPASRHNSLPMTPPIPTGNKQIDALATSTDPWNVSAYQVFQNPGGYEDMHGSEKTQINARFRALGYGPPNLKALNDHMADDAVNGLAALTQVKAYTDRYPQVLGPLIGRWAELTNHLGSSDLYKAFSSDLRPQLDQAAKQMGAPPEAVEAAFYVITRSRALNFQELKNLAGGGSRGVSMLWQNLHSQMLQISQDPTIFKQHTQAIADQFTTSLRTMAQGIWNRADAPIPSYWQSLIAPWANPMSSGFPEQSTRGGGKRIIPYNELH